MQDTITFERPRYQVGTPFTYNGRPGEIVGYHVEYDSDTEQVNATYRFKYEFAGQPITISLPRSTVDRALLQKA